MTLSAEENRKLGALEQTVSTLEANIEYLQRHREECIREIDEKYLTKENFASRFDPVRLIAFGLIAIMATLVVGAIISLVLRIPALVPAAAKIGGL
jgi:hypothetical protein